MPTLLLGVSPDTVKDLTSNGNFIKLVDDADVNGFDICLEGDWKNHSIWVYEKKYNAYQKHEILASAEYHKPLNAKRALESWNELKKSMQLSKTAHRNDYAQKAQEIADYFNKTMGY